MKLKLTLNEEMLGMMPSSKEVLSDFIASKGPNAQTREEEIASTSEDEVRKKGTTIFQTNKDGKPILYDYQLKGMFKDICGFLGRAPGSASSDLRAYKKVIGGLLFVFPRQVVIHVPQDFKEFGRCERPLRIQDANGERTAIAASETVPVGSWMEFEVLLLDPKLRRHVTEWLNYGQLRGLGQWRSGGKGVFSWEEVDTFSEVEAFIPKDFLKNLIPKATKEATKEEAPTAA